MIHYASPSFRRVTTEHGGDAVEFVDWGGTLTAPFQVSTDLIRENPEWYRHFPGRLARVGPAADEYRPVETYVRCDGWFWCSWKRWCLFFWWQDRTSQFWTVLIRGLVALHFIDRHELAPFCPCRQLFLDILRSRCTGETLPQLSAIRWRELLKRTARTQRRKP